MFGIEKLQLESPDAKRQAIGIGSWMAFSPPANAVSIGSTRTACFSACGRSTSPRFVPLKGRKRSLPVFGFTL